MLGSVENLPTRLVDMLDKNGVHIVAIMMGPRIVAI